MARNKFDTDEELDPEFNPHIVKRLLKYLVPYKKRMFVAGLFMIIASFTSLLGPFLIKTAIDVAIPNKDMKLLVLLSSLILMGIVVVWLFLTLRFKIMSKLAQDIIVTIRTDVFSKIQALPFTYFDSRPHGKILIRVVNYVNSLSDLLSNGIIQLITDLFNIIVIVGFMLFINPKLTLVTLATVPVLFITLIILKKKQHAAWQLVSHKQANLNAYLSESLNGMKITQSFAREKENRSIFSNLCAEWKNAWMPAVIRNFLIWPLIDNLSTIGVSLVYFAGIMWFSDPVSVGTLVAFAGYIWRFWFPIQNIGNFYNNMVTTGAYMERIFELLDEPVEVSDIQGAIELPPIRGHVEFSNVNFSYEKGYPILKDVNYVITPGTTVAIVGPTGAGKTTIVNLLSRFYNPDSGQVLIDGIDLKTVQIRSVRKQVGVMLQDSFLFSGTIMDNIRYGKLDATDEEVINAAKAVQAHDFISAYPDGYNTEVNERGSGLSAGQRQLISFARVLLADPRILILDEATSSVDTETERAIQSGLTRLLKGRTSFIIAHRLSTIRNADIIFFIQDGKIMESGTHEELTRLGGFYSKLYKNTDLAEAM
ncbi:MAG TPA: ABC transporter ATP-binding protein [Treponemataceae bacterium]|nr:ABC transporter ATP-binding protein [Treponemataceae bacterium]HQL04884.1 ABC transporter ATP-binding protein [Treponemataceae bacterium]